MVLATPVAESSITIDGETINCEASQFNCYSAMNAYFESGDGAKEMAQVCETLVNKVGVDRNLEESTLRNRLCFEITEGAVIPLDCNPLAVQVGDLMEEYPDQDCSGYGFESPLSSVPGCESVLAETGASSGTSSTAGSSSSGSHSMPGKWMATTGVLYYSLASFVFLFV